MGYADKTLECQECGRSFTFTASEQEFFASKGFANEPKRCPDCRQARKSQRRSTGSGYGAREMYDAVCATCGKETQVPFEPKEGRRVYCSDCYAKLRQKSSA